MSDIELSEAIKKGDETAFKELFDRYYKRVVAYVLTISKDQDLSSDIGQQTFITLWETKEKLDTSKSTKSYLFKIAYNKYIDHCRKTKKKETFIDELKNDSLQLITEDEDIIEKKLKKLRLLIDELPERCREILKLNKIEGLKYKEIAEHFGISQKTVESQMRIAYQKIREGFEGDNELYLFIVFADY
ncbi:RNA polymerase sigma factor [Aestuariibaculum suncheonense]|uniref:RNA polymerase sigma-70 factor n=1 Tax=Aestuariibaculum suncheonense TaxID=1028745 RepID=A0A8J6UB04_9FLAO|nr:RNA polymerase sigma-70 factor [Aestuariibaculum suncheonense]MBD0835440.1 RNA polymerase sigma-70 factor [Aestuariibaculum suncheonense]